jgi:hypothetical protein
VRGAEYQVVIDDERRHQANIPLYLILSIVTFFVWDLYWNWRQMRTCNELLGRKEFGFILWLFLCAITFGLYYFYYQYKMGAAIVEIALERGVEPLHELPLISVAAALLGFGIIADCIHQFEINRIVES